MLARLQTDYIDIGMIHYIDAEDDFNKVFNGEIIEYAKQLKLEGKIKSIGISSLKRWKKRLIFLNFSIWR